MSRISFGYAATLCLAGCTAPAPHTALIPIDHAGLQRRLGVLCHLGVGDDTARAACDTGTPESMIDRFALVDSGAP